VPFNKNRCKGTTNFACMQMFLVFFISLGQKLSKIKKNLFLFVHKYNKLNQEKRPEGRFSWFV
jgi:hypothetical protein